MPVPVVSNNKLVFDSITRIALSFIDSLVVLISSKNDSNVTPVALTKSDPTVELMLAGADIKILAIDIESGPSILVVYKSLQRLSLPPRL